MTIGCPHCDYEMDDPDECYEEGTTYEHECESCEKNFIFSVSYTRDYHPESAECLNGGHHDWKRNRTYPPDFSVMHCSTCHRERRIMEDDK